MPVLIGKHFENTSKEVKNFPDRWLPRLRLAVKCCGIAIYYSKIIFGHKKTEIYDTPDCVASIFETVSLGRHVGNIVVCVHLFTKLIDR